MGIGLRSHRVLDWTIAPEGSEFTFELFPLPAEEAWRQWEIHSCLERHGDHLWMAALEDPEDGRCVDIYCDYCPAGMNEIYPDGIDLVYGRLGSITVEAGAHDSDDPCLPIVMPVAVEIEIIRYTSLDTIYPEYDVSIILYPRS